MAGGGKSAGSDSGLAGDGAIDFCWVAFEEEKESNAVLYCERLAGFPTGSGLTV